MESKSNSQKLISTIIIGCLALAVLAAGGYAIWIHYSGSATETPKSRGTMTVAPKDHIKHYNLFVKLFEEKMASNGNYIFGKTCNGITEDEKAILDKYFDDLRLTVLVRNYNRLFCVLKIPSALKSSKTPEVRDINISDFQNMNEEMAKTTFDKILADQDVMAKMVITIENAREITVINLLNFTINHIPEGLKLFSNLWSIDVSNTGITSLDGLDGLEKLGIILAEDNNITEVPALKNSPIMILLLKGNNIQKIDPEFLSVHPTAAIQLKPKSGTDLSEDIKKLAQDSNGKILISDPTTPNE